MGDQAYTAEVTEPSANGQGRPQQGKQKAGKGSSSSKSFRLSDPELRRKKKVASYKAYAVEGRVKASFRRGFRWIKDKCNNLFHVW